MHRFLLIGVVICLAAFPQIVKADQLVDGSGDVVIEDVGAGEIPELAGYLGGEDAVLSANAAELLKSFGGEAVPELVKVLGDDKKVVPALDILTDIADKGSAGPISQLINDKREGVAGRARYALAQIGDPAVGPLVGLVDRDGYRAQAFETLKAIRNPSDGSKEAVRGLAGSADNAIRTGALEVLGLWKDEDIAGLMPELLKDPDPDIRFAAMNAYRLALDNYDKDMVASVLKDPDNRVRESAATIMSMKPGEAYVQPLIDAYVAEKDGMTRSVLLGALGETGDERARKFLIEGLSDDDPNVVVSALWYIDDYRMTEAVPEVVRIFREKRPVTGNVLVVQEALSSLAALGVKVDLGPFLGYIEAEQPFKTRKLALVMIASAGTSGDEDAIDAVSKLVAYEKDIRLQNLGLEALKSLKE